MRATSFYCTSPEIIIVISWLPEFLLSLHVELITNTTKLLLNDPRREGGLTVNSYTCDSYTMILFIIKRPFLRRFKMLIISVDLCSVSDQSSEELLAKLINLGNKL